MAGGWRSTSQHHAQGRAYCDQTMQRMSTEGRKTKLVGTNTSKTDNSYKVNKRIYTNVSCGKESTLRTCDNIFSKTLKNLIYIAHDCIRYIFHICSCHAFARSCSICLNYINTEIYLCKIYSKQSNTASVVITSWNEESPEDLAFSRD